MRRYLFIIQLFVVVVTPLNAGLKVVVFGGERGWIGQKVVRVLKEAGHEVIPVQVLLQDRNSLEKVILDHNPDYVFNAAGITGKPNVNWCEDHRVETVRANLVGVLNAADVCLQYQKHFIHLGTGCVYQYDERHPMGSGIGFTEEEPTNFKGSFYSHVKCMLDDLLNNYPNVLHLRLRMPISDDLHSKSFVTKIIGYEKIINIPNSMSILSDLLPLIPEMAERKLTGTYNFVNPGVVSHNEILELYKQYINPYFTYENFTEEEQNNLLKIPRSNCQLDASKLCVEFPHLKSIKESIIGVFKKIALGIDQKRVEKGG